MILEIVLLAIGVLLLVQYIQLQNELKKAEERLSGYAPSV